MISIIIPASNEETMLGTCLEALWASQEPGGAVEVIVVANGCHDASAAVAHRHGAGARARGWDFDVIELTRASKIAALNAGDARARHALRAYLDADTRVSPALLRGLCQALRGDAPAYASGRVRIPRPQSWISRAYAAFYREVPFLRQGVPGCGIYAVNAAGRDRWGVFPDIISDDTYVRLLFTPQERHLVPEQYDWPVVEGLGNLVRVRRRQNAGVREVALQWPQMLRNEGRAKMGKTRLARLFLRHPFGFLAYGTVAMLVHLTRGTGAQWSRGR